MKFDKWIMGLNSYKLGKFFGGLILGAGLLAQVSVAQETTGSFANLLPELVDSDENEYVSVIQAAIGIEVTGVLTKRSIQGILEFCDSEGIGNECRKGPLGQVAARAIGAVLDSSSSVASPERTPVSDDTEPVSVAIKLACSGNPGFTRQYSGQIVGNTLSVMRGNRSAEFEEWTGTITGATLEVTGSYLEGAPPEKIISFSLEMNGESYIGSGRRGPRACSVDVIPQG